MSNKKDNLKGYPSIDKPWLKYYSEEAINAPLPKKTLWQYVYENNKDYPDDIAFRYFDAKITYGQFFENVYKTVKSLAAMGVQEEDIVTVMSMHTPETIYLMYALNYLGAVSNMVYMTLSPKEIVDTVLNTQSKLLFVLDPAMEKVSQIQDKLNIPIIVLSVADSMPLHLKAGYRLKNKTKFQSTESYKSFIKRGENTPLPNEASNSEKMAVIVYTSGTTGEPKGVMLSSDNLNAHAFQDINGLMEFSRELSFLFIVPPFLGFGISHIHTLLCGGLELILQIQIDAEIVADRFYKYLPNCFMGSPAYVDAFMDSKYTYKDLSGLKYFVGGGGDISEQKERSLNSFFDKCGSSAKYSSGYGMTETVSTLSVSCNDISKVGSAGLPLLKTNVKVVDIDTGEMLAGQQEGEVHFSSPNLMVGYFKNQAATDEIIYSDTDGTKWIKSGDLGYVDNDGFLFITGRIKRIYFARANDGFAYKLFPQRIEELLETSSEVEACGVIAKDDEARINIAIAFVTLKDKLADTDRKEDIKSELFALAKQELPEHEQPVEIHIIDTMPLTPSGKIDYRKLEELQKKSP